MTVRVGMSAGAQYVETHQAYDTQCAGTTKFLLKLQILPSKENELMLERLS